MHRKLAIIFFSFHRTSVDSSLVLTSEEKWCKTAMLMAASNTPERYGSRMQSLANTSACRIQEVQSPEWYNRKTCTTSIYVHPDDSRRQQKYPIIQGTTINSMRHRSTRTEDVLTESRYIFQYGSTILAHHPCVTCQYTIVCCYSMLQVTV